MNNNSASEIEENENQENAMESENIYAEMNNHVVPESVSIDNDSEDTVSIDNDNENKD